MAGEYQTVYADWKRAPEAFWRTAAGAIDWYRTGEAVFDADAGVYGRWFPGWETNTCHNCIDRHVEAGNGDRTAMIHDSPVTGTKRHITYREAQSEIAALAAVLRAEGVEKGDRVIIYMPMIPEAVFAMLAVARLGAIHSVVFGGFAAQELATRIDDCGARVVISASCGIEPGRVVAYKPLLDHAIELCAHPPQTCLIFQRPQLAAEMVEGRDIDLAGAVAAVKARGETAACVAVAATDPAYILYTSGTTGQPKGVVRDTGGHMVALAWSMRAIYGMEAGEVFWSASDIGWVVGHSYIVYGPLLTGCTTVIFEGKPVGTPDAGTFWRVIQEHDVKVLFTAPTALRAIRRDDPEGAHVARYDLSQFRGLYLAGERADPETIKWAERLLHVPVIDHWWQTETGWAIAANPAGIERLPIKHGSPTVPMPGYDVTVLDDEGHAVAPGTLGNIVVRLPLPPGCLVTFWNADARFRTACLEEFPGYYKTADAGTIDGDGYLFIMARTDDIINCAGHRLSTGGMEEVVARHPAVAECAVIGIHDTLKGQVPCGFLVLKAGVTQDLSVIRREVIELVREEIGPVAAFKSALVVERLPKTRSGKILRGTIQKIADGLPWKMPATIDDPAILDEITAVLHAEEAHHR